MPKLTSADEQFLRSVGILPPANIMSLDEERFALAERIAKHVAPTAQGNPEIARREAVRLAALQRLVKEFRPSTEAE